MTKDLGRAFALERGVREEAEALRRLVYRDQSKNARELLRLMWPVLPHIIYATLIGMLHTALRSKFHQIGLWVVLVETGVAGEEYKGEQTFEAMHAHLEAERAKLCLLDPAKGKLQPGPACGEDEQKFLDVWREKTPDEALTELLRLENVVSNREVTFGASKRAWMGKRINLLKQIRVAHRPPPDELKADLEEINTNVDHYSVRTAAAASDELRAASSQEAWFDRSRQLLHCNGHALERGSTVFVYLQGQRVDDTWTLTAMNAVEVTLRDAEGTKLKVTLAQMRNGRYIFRPAPS